jgi:hypothetical protein
VVLAGLLAVGLWLVLRRESATVPSAPIHIEPSAIPPPSIPPSRPAVDPSPTVAARGGEQVRGDTAADRQRPDVAPAPAPSSDDMEHPHPITAKHVRIQHENVLIGTMNDAMDLGDGATLRRFLKQYEDEYPEDPNDLQRGYRIIADCLERPGAESQAAGQRYYDVERGSILRVFVGRHCLRQ